MKKLCDYHLANYGTALCYSEQTALSKLITDNCVILLRGILLASLRPWSRKWRQGRRYCPVKVNIISVIEKKKRKNRGHALSLAFKNFSGVGARAFQDDWTLEIIYIQTSGIYRSALNGYLLQRSWILSTNY